VGAGVGHFQGRENGVQTLGPGLGAGNLERHPGLGDLPLGAGQALQHGRLGHQEGAGDLLRRQPADQPQGQGRARLGRDGRVAANEDQPQALVGDQSGVGRQLRLDRGLRFGRIRGQATTNIPSTDHI